MEKTYLYKAVANRIVSQVDKGTFRPGDRIPSIRDYSKQSRVSINTVKAAYSYLEDCCVIEARPQSGYYVCARLPEIPPEPAISPDQLSPLKISPSALVAKMMRDSVDSKKIQFGAAIPDPALLPSKKIGSSLTAEVRRNINLSVEYNVASGFKQLRSQIARRMIKAGCTLNPDDLVITSGASEAVFLALSSICKPGNTVAISSPIYFNFVQMFQLLDLRVIEIPNSPTEGINLKVLRSALKHNSVACCLVVSNFDNPMGSSLSDARKQELIKLLGETATPLIEDDINGDLAHGDDRPTVAKSWDTTGNVLLCSSFSKTIAPGYRVGWIAPGRFIQEILHRKMITTIGSAIPTQMAIADFLKNGGYDHHLRKIRKAYAEKVARMTDAIGRYFPAGTRVTRPQGGFTLWVELPEKVNTVAMFAKSDAQSISFAPGILFSNDDKYAHCLRLNSAFWSVDTQWAVKTLGQLAHELIS